MRRPHTRWVQLLFLLLAAALLAALGLLLWRAVPNGQVRLGLLGICGGLFLLAFLWRQYQRRQVVRFADELCQTLDALMAGRQPEGYQPYEDTLTAKVQGKLLQYDGIVREGRRQSQQDKQTLQELVSDISHQVKTPMANIRMFADLLEKPQLTAEKRAEFSGTMSAQINKLDFLLASLIKMSRLETGTFVLHMEDNHLYDTIAQAVGTIFAKADQKNIQIEVDCESTVTVQHDGKWTAEALENILDNAVKYTPAGGKISISVRPWQFYTRIDITDTGIGVPSEHYHDVFRRFYRTQETAMEEGVGLGLYLARSIITRQKGYISVKSEVGKGTTFSVFLLS